MSKVIKISTVNFNFQGNLSTFKAYTINLNVSSLRSKARFLKKMKNFLNMS